MTITQALLGFAAVAAMLTLIPGLDTTLVLRSAVTAGRRQAFATAMGISTGALIWGAAAALGAAALLAASHLAYQVLTIAGAGYLCWLGLSMIVRTWPGVMARLRGVSIRLARPSRGYSTDMVAQDRPSPDSSTDMVAQDRPSRGYSTDMVAQDRPSPDSSTDMVAQDRPSPDSSTDMVAQDRHSRGPSVVASSSWLRALATGVWTNLLNPKIGVFYIATIPQFIPDGASSLGMGLLLAGVHDVMALVWFALLIGIAHRARRWLANDRAIRIIDRLAGTVLIAFGMKLALSRH